MSRRAVPAACACVVALAASQGLAAPTQPVGTALPPLMPASTGKTFYVSVRGRDSGPGTAAAPWRTIQKALSTLRPGQRALVRRGTYTEDLELTRAGTATAPITVAAYPGDTVVLHPASSTGNTIPLEIDTGAAYFRIRGFVIEGSRGTSSADVYITGTANHIELSHDEIRSGQDQGFLADRTTSYLYLLGNTIHDNGQDHLSGQHQSHGIYLEGAYDLVANNVIYNQPFGFGLQIYPANHDTIVTDNTIASSAHSSIVVGGSAGVYNITIRDNILYDDNWGVEMDSSCPTGPVTIDHNVIYAYRVTPIQSGCSSVDTSGGNIIADPRFVDYARRRLAVERRSPAVDAALSPWSASTDALGRRRPLGAAPDIGAFETAAAKRGR